MQLRGLRSTLRYALLHILSLCYVQRLAHLSQSAWRSTIAVGEKLEIDILRIRCYFFTFLELKAIFKVVLKKVRILLFD